MAVINISNNFSDETSMAAELGSLQCYYIYTLRAVESLVTIVIIFFKGWKVAFQSMHNLAAFSVPRNNWVQLETLKAIVKLYQTSKELMTCVLAGDFFFGRI